MVSIAPFSTRACPDCSRGIQKTALFCMFSLFNFSSIFSRGSADPICPYVRTPTATSFTELEVYRPAAYCIVSRGGLSRGKDVGLQTISSSLVTRFLRYANSDRQTYGHVDRNTAQPYRGELIRPAARRADEVPEKVGD